MTSHTLVQARPARGTSGIVMYVPSSVEMYSRSVNETFGNNSSHNTIFEHYFSVRFSGASLGGGAPDPKLPGVVGVYAVIVVLVTCCCVS